MATIGSAWALCWSASLTHVPWPCRPWSSTCARLPRREQLASWSARWPGPIPDTVAVAEPLERPTFELEGHELTAVDVGYTDTDHTSVLHVPDIGLVVAGDAAYNDVHVHLGESPTEQREQWPAALD